MPDNQHKLPQLPNWLTCDCRDWDRYPDEPTLRGHHSQCAWTKGYIVARAAQILRDEPDYAGELQLTPWEP